MASLVFTVVDTAGLEEGDPASLAGRMRAQTEAALADCDAVMFLIDARAGVTAADRHFAQALRRVDKPILLVANKVEGRAGRDGALDAYELGLGEPIALSAEHGEGTSDLYEALRAVLPEAAPQAEEEAASAERRRTTRTGRRSIRRSLCASPCSAGPTPASRRCSIASSARSGC